MNEVTVAKARKIIDLDGKDGYRSAANIVGADKADELLANLVARNMGTTPDDEEVQKFVSYVRSRKGFSCRPSASDEATSAPATIKDVHRAFGKAHDIITVTMTVTACGVSRGEHHTNYDENWRKSFDEKANAFVGVIVEEMGSGWTNQPPDTLLGPKAQEAFRAVRELLTR